MLPTLILCRWAGLSAYILNICALRANHAINIRRFVLCSFFAPFQQWIFSFHSCTNFEALTLTSYTQSIKSKWQNAHTKKMKNKISTLVVCIKNRYEKKKLVMAVSVYSNIWIRNIYAYRQTMKEKIYDYRIKYVLQLKVSNSLPYWILKAKVCGTSVHIILLKLKRVEFF